MTHSLSLLGYVCGQVSCWPTGAIASTARYATSGELCNHFKEHHADEPCGSDDTPFRCGLKDCKKGWKVRIPGLRLLYDSNITVSYDRASMACNITCKC